MRLVSKLWNWKAGRTVVSGVGRPKPNCAWWGGEANLRRSVKPRRSRGRTGRGERVNARPLWRATQTRTPWFEAFMRAIDYIDARLEVVFVHCAAKGRFIRGDWFGRFGRRSTFT